ncbi:cytochrome c-type biogenesis protein [Archaeoglobus neptunius]|uniref:cytochrome c-type biogenesis protein n=1 Tax=Archaeoglobus neptunius TaxID=2798580 RepID=UPI001925B445|nr:cytochrome c-type biogenesis protein CcmH [Archaeoglobus neptunius]
MKKVAVLFLFFAIPTVYATALEDLEGDLFCACGCGKLLRNCDCEVSYRMRDEIKSMLSSGASRDEVISALQEKYGRNIIATPPKEGFFLGLWYYPGIVVVAGLIIVYALLNRRKTSWLGDPDDTINYEEEMWYDEE